MDNKNPTNHISSNYFFEECKANVLIAQENKSFQEYEANIMLQYCYGKNWMLMVCIHEKDVFSYKVERAIIKRPIKNQHDIIWIGKRNSNWKLKFDDNKQWHLFQRLHKECYKKNVEVASLHPEIAIPSVRFIEDIPPKKTI